MAQVLIRDLDKKTVDRLKRRAARRGRTLQAELRDILERAAAVDNIDARALAERIQRDLQATGQKFSDSTEMIAADRRR